MPSVRASPQLGLVAGLLLSGVAATSRAQDTTAPSSPGAPPPATLPAIPATQAVVDVPVVIPLRTMLTAVRNGEPDKIPPVCYVASLTDEQVVASLVEYARAVADYRKAVAANFGAAAVEAALPAMAKPQDLDVVAATINGDKALLRGEGISPTPAIKVGDVWKINVSELAGQSGMASPQAATMLQSMSKVIRDTAVDVTAGKFKSADELNTAIDARIGDATSEMMKAAPTTEPAK